MSIFPEIVGRTTSARAMRGMSLVELLVATVLFIVLLAGLSALFTGAISATRTGYLNMEAFERVRGSLKIIEQDLTGAFTAREYGDYYQFFGGPQGFCFVGTVENAGLARVTYVVHPTAEAVEFTASHVETYGDVHTRLRNHVQSYGDATVFARFLGAIGDQLPGVPDPNLEAAQLPAALREAIVDFPEIHVTTQSLVRFVEIGVNDLDTFEIVRANGTFLQWPELDLDDPNNDFYDANDPDSLRLYIYLLDAFNPYVLPNDFIPAGVEDLQGLILAANPNDDMRVIYANSDTTTMTRDTLETLYRAKRREIWIRMLAGEDGLPNFWGDPNNALDQRPKAEDYVVTDALLAKMSLDSVPDFDVVGTPQMFFYRSSISGDNSIYARSFNSVERVAGYSYSYPDFQGNTPPTFAQDPANGLATIDEYYTGWLNNETISPAMFGSPLFPRLPGMVSPGFWLIVPAKWVNSKDFLRWFTQDINIPSAAGRNVKAVVTRREQL